MFASTTALVAMGIWLNVCGPRMEPLSTILVEDDVTGKWLAFDTNGDRLAACYEIKNRNVYLSVYGVRDAKLINSVELGDKSNPYRLSHPAPFGPNADWVAYPDVHEIKFLPLRDKPAPPSVVVRPKEFIFEQDVYISTAKHKAYMVEVLTKMTGFRVREFDLDPAAKQKPVVTELPGRGTNAWNAAGSFEFSPEKRLLAAGFQYDEDRRGRLELWTLAEKPQVKHVETKLKPVSLAFSPKDPVLATAFMNGTVELYDTATAKPIGDPIKLNNRTVACFSFHPSGKYLACGTLDSRGATNLYFIEVATRKVVAKLAATNWGVWTVAFDPTGDRVAVLGGAGVIKIFDARALLKLDKK